MRERLSRLPALALMTALGCAPTARSITAPSSAHSDTNSESRTSDPSGENEEAPEPPAPLALPRLSPILVERFDGGPEVCASTRPDLARTLVSLRLRSALPPEELHLLRRWLMSAIEQELGDLTVTWDPPACEGHFLCLSGPPQSAERLGQAVLSAISGPDSAAFYRVRLDALASASAWDRADADWKLNTAARALRAQSPGTSRLAHLPLVDEKALLSIVEKHSGAAKEKSLPLYTLEKQLAGLVGRSSLTISSPKLGTGSLAALRDHFRAPSLDAPQPTALVAAQETPLRLSDDAPDVAQAILVWELPHDAPLRSITGALSLLVTRFQARKNSPIRLRVHPAGGLYALPSLRVDGAYEDVLGAISELSEEYDRFISTYGAASEEEWDAAQLRAPTIALFEPRCDLTEGLKEPAERMNRAREILRAAGPPSVVIWGSETPPTPSE